MTEIRLINREDAILACPNDTYRLLTMIEAQSADVLQQKLKHGEVGNKCFALLDVSSNSRFSLSSLSLKIS